MNKFTPLWSAILFMCVYTTFGQVEIINIPYDSITNSLNFKNVPNKVKAHKDYLLILTHINTAHVTATSSFNAYSYVSELPEILKPIFLGVPNNAVLGQFQLKATETNTRLFLKAMNHYDKLQIIENSGNDYYERTKFNPIPGDTVPLYHLKHDLKLNSVQEIANQLIMSEQFILGAIASYEYSFELIDVRDPILEIVHAEYATLRNIKERIDRSVFRKSLQFLIASEHAKNEMVLDRFTATKDINTVSLQVENTFTGETIFDGDVHFKTYQDWSLDVTTGFFASNIIEAQYYLEPRNETTNNVSREDPSELDISIGALAHWSYTFSPKVMAGISLGASLSPFDGKLRYLAGGSLLFGEQKHFALNVGVAFAKMKVLSEGIPKDGGGYYQPKELTTINTVDRIKSGLYVGLTYNFINKKQ